MTQKPDALFIVDSHLENLAIREALSTKVTTVAIVDTNADPFIIDYPIPANDDAVGSIKLIVSHILNAFAEGVKAQKEEKKEEEKEEKVKIKPKEKVKEKKAKETKVKTSKPKVIKKK